MLNNFHCPQFFFVQSIRMLPSLSQTGAMMIKINEDCGSHVNKIFWWSLTREF